jgi:alkylation response protein AidB-like acyl-CoA dehydrogenase
MKLQLEARSEPGQRFVALAEQHADAFRQTSADYDRLGEFPQAFVEAMKDSGFIGGCIPDEFGGLGVESVHDTALAMSRLGRGDGSISIGITMHFLSSWGMTRRWRMAGASDALGNAMREVAAGKRVMAVFNSESGSDNRHPFAEATKVEGGYRLNGRKGFGTLSPAADQFSVRVRMEDGGGGYQMAQATIRRDMPGVTFAGNWDAMGMRASGSQDVVLDDVFIPDSALAPPTPWGILGSAASGGGTVSALALPGVFMGIAEEALRLTFEGVARRKKQPGASPLAHWYPVQEKVAEMVTGVNAMRAMLHRTGVLADAFLLGEDTGMAAPATGEDLLMDAQTTKRFINRTAIEVVDMAMTVAGGGGYVARNRLSQLYRDVRAGPFMSPFNEFEAAEYIGRIALGLPGEGPLA